MYDSLDEKYRYCVYCEADCWLEPENQMHDPSCPERTGVFPIASVMLQTGAVCDKCSRLFTDGDYYMLANNNIVTCIGCMAAINILGVEDDKPF